MSDKTYSTRATARRAAIKAGNDADDVNLFQREDGRWGWTLHSEHDSVWELQHGSEIDEAASEIIEHVSADADDEVIRSHFEAFGITGTLEDLRAALRRAAGEVVLPTNEVKRTPQQQGAITREGNRKRRERTQQAEGTAPRFAIKGTHRARLTAAIAHVARWVGLDPELVTPEFLVKLRYDENVGRSILKGVLTQAEVDQFVRDWAGHAYRNEEGRMTERQLEGLVKDVRKAIAN